MACNFGWDWGPDLVDGRHLAAGLAATRGRAARLAAVRPLVDVGRRRDGRRVHVDVERAPDAAADRPRRDRRRRPRRGASRPGRPRQWCRSTVDDAGAVVAARATAPSRSTTCDVTLADGDEPSTAGDGRDRVPHGRARHRAPTTHGTAVRVRGQRPTRLRQGRQLDPRRLPSRTGSTRDRYADAARAGRGRRHQPAAGLGRRHLRGRRLLRRVRRARAARLAGLPVRLRGVRRGGAAARRGRGRGPRQRHPAGAAPQPGALERQQREPLGLRGLGLAGAARRPDLGRRATTTTCCPRIVAELDPTRPYIAGQPLVRPTDRHPNDPGARHHAHLGRLEPARLHGLPRLPAPLRRRVRLAGTADLVDPDASASTTIR